MVGNESMDIKQSRDPKAASGRTRVLLPYVERPAGLALREALQDLGTPVAPVARPIGIYATVMCNSDRHRLIFGNGLQRGD